MTSEPIPTGAQLFVAGLKALEEKHDREERIERRIYLTVVGILAAVIVACLVMAVLSVINSHHKPDLPLPCQQYGVNSVDCRTAVALLPPT